MRVSTYIDGSNAYIFVLMKTAMSLTGNKENRAKVILQEKIPRGWSWAREHNMRGFIVKMQQ